jgi:hypothetical protein
VTRSWRMFAGRTLVHGRFMHFGEEFYVRLYGDEPVPVELTEDPDGVYWGGSRRTAQSRGVVGSTPAHRR